MSKLEHNYNNLYSNGGFRYSKEYGIRHLRQLVHLFDFHGKKILDLPCGDGFWSRMLRQEYSAYVTSADISEVGIQKANGVLWDAEEYNPEWHAKFDLVFCRGISHLHFKEIDAKRIKKVVENCARYAPETMIIYYTKQNNTDSGNHFHHTKMVLNDILLPKRSKMVGNFYVAML